MKNLFILIALFFSACTPASENKSTIVAFTGATVWTSGPAGTLEKATMLVERGKIVAVGAEVENGRGPIDGDGTGAEDIARAVGEGAGGDGGESSETVGAAEGQGAGPGFGQGAARGRAGAG